MPDDLRSLFLLEPGLHFLNHGSYGACPREVYDAWQGWQLRMERQPVAFHDFRRGLSSWLGDVRKVMAAELGCSDESIVGLTNATVALNAVARSLDLKAGDEIVTTNHEYAALDKTWSFVARRTGARIVPVEVPLPLTSAEDFTRTVVGAFTGATRVLFLSHITSATALRFPIEAAVAEARSRGIITVIDGAHAPAHIPLSLDALGADFYAGNFHKWLMAPKGSAFLYARPEWQPSLDPPVISHGWTEDAGVPGARGGFGNSAFIDSFEMWGTRDPTAWLATPAALDFRRRHDWDAVAERCRLMVQDTAARVRELTGGDALSSAEFCAPQMVSMPVPDCDPVWLHDALLDRHAVEIPCFRWNDKTIVRLSVQGYNTQADLDALVNGLEDCLRHAGR